MNCAPGETSAAAAWSGLNKSGFGTYVLEDTFNGYEGDGTCFTSGHDKQSDGGGDQRSAVNGGGEDLNNLETLATDADDRVLSVDEDMLKCMPQGQARLGTLLAREQNLARKRRRTTASDAEEHHEGHPQQQQQRATAA